MLQQQHEGAFVGGREEGGISLLNICYGQVFWKLIKYCLGFRGALDLAKPEQKKRTENFSQHPIVMC